MAELTAFLLASYGTTNILTGGRICEPMRAWFTRRSRLAGHWVRCPMCIGLPVGMGWSLLVLAPVAGLDPIRQCLVAGAASSGWCWMVHVVLQRLGKDDL